MVLTSSFMPVAGGLQYELKWLMDGIDNWLEENREVDFHFVYPGPESEPYARFANIQSRMFPVAVTFLVPEKFAK